MRTRPNYSIALLEKIKHIFDCDNIKFILITNYDQMMAAVKHLYGSDVDAHRYLDKFVKFKINLSNEMYENGRTVHVSQAYLNHLIEQSEELKKYINTLIDSHDISFLGDLIVNSNISLRETGKFVSYLELYYALKYKGRPSPLEIWHLVSTFTIFCLVVEHNVVEKIIKDDFRTIDICKYLGFSHYTKADSYSSENRSYTKELATLFTIAFCDKTIPGYVEFDESEFKKWMEHFHLNPSMNPSSLKARTIKEIISAMKLLQFITLN